MYGGNSDSANFRGGGGRFCRWNLKILHPHPVMFSEQSLMLLKFTIWLLIISLYDSYICWIRLSVWYQQMVTLSLPTLHNYYSIYKWYGKTVKSMQLRNSSNICVKMCIESNKLYNVHHLYICSTVFLLDCHICCKTPQNDM